MASAPSACNEVHAPTQHNTHAMRKEFFCTRFATRPLTQAARYGHPAAHLPAVLPATSEAATAAKAAVEWVDNLTCRWAQGGSQWYFGPWMSENAYRNDDVVQVEMIRSSATGCRRRKNPIGNGWGGVGRWWAPDRVSAPAMAGNNGPGSMTVGAA